MTNQEAHTRLIDKYREIGTDPMSTLYKTWGAKDLRALEHAIGCILAAEVVENEGEAGK